MVLLESSFLLFLLLFYVFSTVSSSDHNSDPNQRIIGRPMYDTSKLAPQNQTRTKPLAIFRFEASKEIGAGHAIRSSVLADALVEKGWKCQIVTKEESYQMIPALARFQRIDPDLFDWTPVSCDLLIVDNYALDVNYEKRFRAFAKKILVIDDLKRQHDCDFLVDFNYGRKKSDYHSLVPQNCQLFIGNKYVFIRSLFAEKRLEALKKRRATTKIERILISMGGGDFQNTIVKALELIKRSRFTGHIDIVLGFREPKQNIVRTYVQTHQISNCTFHVNPNMIDLMMKTDLAIGAGGTSVWERCCLGLPQMIFQIVDNQEIILRNMASFVAVDEQGFLSLFCPTIYQQKITASSQIVDGLGVKRLLNVIIDGVTQIQ